MFPVKVINTLSQKPNIVKRFFLPEKLNNTQDSLTEIKHPGTLDVSRQCLLLTSKVVLGSTTDSTTVSSNLRSKICTASPKGFVEWYG